MNRRKGLIESLRDLFAKLLNIKNEKTPNFKLHIKLHFKTVYLQQSIKLHGIHRKQLKTVAKYMFGMISTVTLIIQK